MIGGLLLVVALVAMNGFFVAAEFAFVSLRRTRVEEMVNQGRLGSGALMFAIDNMNRSVAACQLGITVASLALGYVSEPVIAHALRPLVAALPDGWHGPASHAISVFITLLIITYMHVVFGE